MHRNGLIDMLERYERAHPGEVACARRILELVRAHDDCFDRRCLPGHITASAWIVSHDHTRFLMTHHRKLGRWLQLGGHADGEANVLDVALREAREESGMQHFSVPHSAPPAAPMPVDIDVHRIPAHGGEPEHEHHDIRFLFVAAGEQALRISDESNDLRWFELRQLDALGTDESVHRLARKARRLLRPARR